MSIWIQTSFLILVATGNSKTIILCIPPTTTSGSVNDERKQYFPHPSLFLLPFQKKSHHGIGIDFDKIYMFYDKYCVYIYKYMFIVVKKNM